MAGHDPTLARTARFGCWATCSCGWRSQLYTTTTGAHVAFGRHLLETTRQQRSERNERNDT